MEIKSYADLQKIQAHFESLFTKQLDALGKKQPQSADSLLAARRAKLESARNAVAAAERRHATLVKRAEAELADHRETVARLESELAEHGAQAGKAPRAKKPARVAKPK